MNAQDVHRRLREVSEQDEKGLAQLAGEIAEQCRRPAHVAVEEWVRGQNPSGCAFLCAQLKELAIAEMLQNIDAAPVGAAAQMLEQIVQQQMLFREFFLVVLEPLLKPIDTSTPAYLLTRRLVEPLPEEAEQFSTEEQFRGFSEKQRHEEIDRWIDSQTWKLIFPDPSPPPA